MSGFGCGCVRQEVKEDRIPAHEGHEGNELADTLAKKGALETETITPIPLPKAAAYAALRERTKSPYSHQSKHMETLWNDDFRGTLCKLNKTDLRTATQILTGHCLLNHHKHKINRTDSPLCNACGLENETIKHILTTCPALWRLRQECFDRLCPTIPYIRDLCPLYKTIKFYRRAVDILHPRGEES